MSVDYIGLFGDNPIALKIAREQTDYWEFRLTSELLREQLKGPARQWSDLKDGLYTRRISRLSASESMPWFQSKISEASNFLPPLKELYTVRLARSWGEPGEPGDAEEIAHVCSLIGGMAAELVRWEEDVAFTRCPDVFEGLRKGLSGAAGHQLDALMKVPEVIEYGIDQAANSAEDDRTVVNHTIVFDLPPGWSENLDREFAKLNSLIGSGQFQLG